MAHDRLGRSDSARLAFEQALALDGSYAIAERSLAAGYEQAGEFDKAHVALEEAVSLSRKHRKGAQLAWALALLAGLPDGDVAAAEAALKEAGESGNTPQVRYRLWKAKGDPTHLAEAKRLLDHLAEHAPEECRESMLTNVKLHREILEAWEAYAAAVVPESGDA